MSIYTRTGDTGETSLFGGKRVLKCEELVDAYGSIDELNSWVGLIVSDSEVPKEHREFLKKVQGDLFIIGGSLAGGPLDLSPIEMRVPEMEVAIDVMEEKLPALKNFIIPGGSTAGARIHLARSVCRRVERQVVQLATQAMRARSTTRAIQDEKMKIIIRYLNRLSDLFFVLARTINREAKVPEIVWTGVKVNQKK